MEGSVGVDWGRARRCRSSASCSCCNGKLYACRHCYDLRYASQREHLGDRALRKAQKIREQLGGDASLISPLPDKPKGMHWRTYDDLVAKLEAAEGVTNDHLLEWLSRLRG